MQASNILPASYEPIDLGGLISRPAAQYATGLQSLSMPSNTPKPSDFLSIEPETTLPDLNHASAHTRTFVNAQILEMSFTYQPNGPVTLDISRFTVSRLQDDLQQNQNKALKAYEAHITLSEEDAGHVMDTDYWGVDQTAQRIVDFGTAFYKGEDKSDFIQLLKDLVDEAFGEAEKILGELPQISTDTHTSIFDKLDAWAANTENTSGYTPLKLAA